MLKFLLLYPSYASQIVTLTYPHIGNTGCNPEDVESDRVWATGLVIRDLPVMASSWRMDMTLAQYLAAQRVVAIADIDTRRLTRLIRTKGALAGCIMTGDVLDVDAALRAARGFPGLNGMDLAAEVTCGVAHDWRGGSWKFGEETELFTFDFIYNK